MKVSILQLDITWASPAANRRRAEEALADVPADSCLIVLPEMFSTGFATEPEGVAEPACSPTLEWMRQTADMRGCAVAGSIAVRDGDCYRNRLYFVKPDGEAAYYDKHHLFTYGGEHTRYVPGSERLVVEWLGVRFLPLVCYDLRFPVWSRNREDYDVAVYVANWPGSRIKAWDTLLRARAIENQCYVIGVNRVGTDPVCAYSGHSAVIDPYGNDIALCPPDTKAVATADLDMRRLNAFRDKFPVLKDRD